MILLKAAWHLIHSCNAKNVRASEPVSLQSFDMISTCQDDDEEDERSGKKLIWQLTKHILHRKPEN